MADDFRATTGYLGTTAGYLGTTADDLGAAIDDQGLARGRRELPLRCAALTPVIRTSSAGCGAWGYATEFRQYPQDWRVNVRRAGIDSIIVRRRR
jgi:hypothetical protein